MASNFDGSWPGSCGLETNRRKPRLLSAIEQAYTGVTSPAAKQIQPPHVAQESTLMLARSAKTYVFQIGTLIVVACVASQLPAAAGTRDLQAAGKHGWHSGR